MRKCIVKGIEAYFHCWGKTTTEAGHQCDGNYSMNECSIGIIEYLDGKVDEVPPHYITFEAQQQDVDELPW